MHGLKLEYFLRKLESSERIAFIHSLTSHEKDKQRTLGKLAKLLTQNWQDKKRVYQNLYPKKTFSDRHWRNLRSDLLNCLYDFLIQQEFEHSLQKPVYLARALNRLQATRHWQSSLSRFQQETTSIEALEAAVGVNMQEIVHQKAVSGRKDLSFEDLSQSSEEAFVARTLYIQLARQDYQKGRPTTISALPSPILWETILQQLRQGAWQESRLIQAYYGLWQLLQDPETPNIFYKMREDLRQHGEQFAQEEAQQLYTGLLNHAIRQLNQGQKAYALDIFDLYREMLRRQLLISERSISAWHFKSIVRVALLNGEYQWAQDFIDEYESYLPPQFQARISQFCRALLHFFRKDFEMARNHLHRVLDDYNDPFLGLDARSWLLRIYYETEDLEGIDSLLNSFRQFLRRHKDLSPERLKNYREYVRFFRRMIALRPDQDQKAKLLWGEIQNSSSHAGRDWFEEKLELAFPGTTQGQPQESRP